jgi:Cu2+-exporting ATPase
MLALFVLDDIERAGAGDTIAALRALGLTCHLVSGDSVPTVRWWAAHLQIDHRYGRVTPEGKRDYVARLQRAGAVVLAVGDGINDAPALAQAQVSIAIGSGAPLAQAGADAVLTHGGIGEIARALSLARSTRRVVRQNLVWAFAYNLIAIPLAATGHVEAWMAGIGMSLSSLLVVANAWRLSRAGHRED